MTVFLGTNSTLTVRLHGETTGSKLKPHTHTHTEAGVTVRVGLVYVCARACH